MDQGTIRDTIHASVGLVYVAFLLCLTCFWPSVSLITLLCAHVVMVVIVNMGQVMKGGAQERIAKYIYDAKEFHWSQSLSFHLTKENNNWMNMIHLIVLFVNLVAYLAVIHNASPPTTITLGGERAFDHSKLGLRPPEGAPMATPVMNMVSQNEARTVQLAQSGFYYAEEYTGYFGMGSQVVCGGSSGWRCFAVGVRVFQATNQRQGSNLTGWKDRSIYQPLPTPAYEVDVQVGVNMGDTNASCASLSPIYIQHVSGQGNVIGPYRPVMDFAWSDTPDKAVCPPGTIGCVNGQRQSLVNYTTSLRSWCSSNRVVHRSNVGDYSAAYIRIPGEMSTVDATSGGVRHTIIIMNSSATTKPPVLRVRAKDVTTGIPLRSIFVPVGPVPFPPSGDATELQERESQYDFSTSSLVFGQRYGVNAPIAQLAQGDVPPEYMRRNYQSSMWLYVTFFTIPILIAWYYMVTVVYDFGSKPFVYNATFVRLPLLGLGIYVGSLFYCLGQASTILAHVTRDATSGEKGRVVPGYSTTKGTMNLLLTLASITFNVVHIILWSMYVMTRMDLVSNSLYLGEMSAGSVVVREWGSNLAAPLAFVFLLVEPILTSMLYTAVALAGMTSRG